MLDEGAVRRALGLRPTPRRALRDERSYVIGTAGRSASTLLSVALDSTGELGRPEEYLHSGNFGSWSRTWGVAEPVDARSRRAYLDAMRRGSASDSGVRGLKLHTGSMDVAMVTAGVSRRRSLSHLLHALDISHVVHVTRQDKVAAAFSFWRAARTGEYQRYDDSEPAVVHGEPDPVEIEDTHAFLHRSDAMWRTLDPERFRVIELDHDEIIADLSGSVQAVARFLEQPSVQLTPGGRLPTKIRDGRLSEMIDRWKAEHPPCSLCGATPQITVSPRQSA